MAHKIVIPLSTPVGVNREEVHSEAFDNMCNRLKEAIPNQFINRIIGMPGGTNSFGQRMSIEERRECSEAANSVFGKENTWCAITASSPLEVVRSVQECDDFVSAFVISPLTVFEHESDLVKLFPLLDTTMPLYAYHIPVAKTCLKASDLIALSKLENFAGIKVTEPDLGLLAEFVKQVSDINENRSSKIQLYLGDSSTYLERDFYKFAAGFISGEANVCPEALLAMTLALEELEEGSDDIARNAQLEDLISYSYDLLRTLQKFRSDKFLPMLITHYGALCRWDLFDFEISGDPYLGFNLLDSSTKEAIRKSVKEEIEPGVEKLWEKCRQLNYIK